MSNSPHSKRKSKIIEPITFDELRDAAGMSGFVSFLNTPPTDSVLAPVETTPVEGVGVETPPSRVEIAPVGRGGAAKAPVALLSTPVDSNSPVTAPDVIAPVVFSRPATGEVIFAPVKGGKNLHHCSTAGEGHSHLEEALYQLLWRAATPISSDIRVAQVSQSDLARQLRITDKNMRIALQRLISKLSIEIIAAPDFALKLAKQYRVYSSRAIVERRREAGMEWVIRNKGIQFVSNQQAEHYRAAGSTLVDSR